MQTWPAFLSTCHGVCSRSWTPPRGWFSAYDAQTMCPTRWSAYIGCAFRSASSLKWPYLRTRSSMVARHRTLVHSSVWPTYRVDELFAPPKLAASSSHSLTGPPLATEPFLLVVPRSGTVCHRRSHQRHHWTPFASDWTLICSPCHIWTYNYRNWLTSVSGPCSNFLLRPLWKFLIDWLIDWLIDVVWDLGQTGLRPTKTGLGLVGCGLGLSFGRASLVLVL